MNYGLDRRSEADHKASFILADNFCVNAAVALAEHDVLLVLKCGLCHY